MKIENKEITNEKNYLDSVTYVPGHAHGNAGHPDCEQGVIVKILPGVVKVMFCKSRTVQSTNPDDLVWG